MLREGGFVSNIKGKMMHAVDLDEAHEMLINKDIKTSCGEAFKRVFE